MLLFATSSAITVTQSVSSLHPCRLRCPQSRPIVAGLKLGGAEGKLGGYARSILRSEAGRRFEAGLMATYQVAAPEEVGDVETIEQCWKEKYLKAIDDLLNKHELIRVKIRGAKKRSRAAHLGGILALASDALIVQSIGHTVLMYRSFKDGSGINISPNQDESEATSTSKSKDRTIKK